MIDERTVMLYLALVLSVVGVCVCGVAALTLLYLHVWLAAIVWAMAAACFGASLLAGLKAFRI
jgi:hypothetical protein